MIMIMIIFDMLGMHKNREEELRRILIMIIIIIMIIFDMIRMTTAAKKQTNTNRVLRKGREGGTERSEKKSEIKRTSLLFKLVQIRKNY